MRIGEEVVDDGLGRVGISTRNGFGAGEEGRVARDGLIGIECVESLLEQDDSE